MWTTFFLTNKSCHILYSEKKIHNLVKSERTDEIKINAQK